jgi:hypothetical protein
MRPIEPVAAMGAVTTVVVLVVPVVAVIPRCGVVGDTLAVVGVIVVVPVHLAPLRPTGIAGRVVGVVDALLLLGLARRGVAVVVRLGRGRRRDEQARQHRADQDHAAHGVISSRGGHPARLAPGRLGAARTVAVCHQY